MNALSAARFLVDFDAVGDPVTRAPLGRVDAAGPSHNAICGKCSTSKDEGYQHGFAEGQTAAEAQLQAGLQQQAEEFDARLAAMRQHWLQEQAEALSSGLSGALQEIEGRLGDAVADVLLPVLDVAVHKQAIGRFRTLLCEALAGDMGTCIQVEGPPDLLHLLSEQLGDKAQAVSFEPVADGELRFRRGQTTVKTDLVEWADMIREAMS